VAGVAFIVLLIVGVVILAVTPKATAKTLSNPGGTPAPTAAAVHTSSPPVTPTSRPPAAPATVKTPKAPPRTSPPPPPPPPPPTHAAVPPPTQAAPPPPPPTTQAEAPAGCTPKTDAGNCYQPGEFCRDSDHGVTGVAGDGKSIECEDNDGWRWEPV
jgi:hypothetical protein